MKLTKKSVYIGLFSVLYLIVAFSSFWHACAFFGLANNSWMSIILAFAFEIGQAAVLFSLLTSKKDRSRVMPWVLMTMFTLVQVIGNVFSSYKYIVTNSIENLRFFKEPIFIWTTLPDDQATVIIVYIVGAILPVCALLLTSMITNYLSDQEEEKIKELENKENEIETQPSKTQEGAELSTETKFEKNQENENNEIEKSQEDKRKELIQDSLEQIKEKVEQPLKVEIEKLKEDHDKVLDEKFDVQKKFDSLLNDYDEQNKELYKLKKELEELKNKEQQELSESEREDLIKTFNELNKEPKVYNPDEVDKQKVEDLTGIDKAQMEELIKNGIQEDNQENEKKSHFINQ